MLKSIIIKNFALVESVEVDFSSGFSVITGETGAGKSVFLGAIAMMLGQRSDVKAIRDGADRCVIEGHFDISSFALEPFFAENDLDYCADDCIIRRELSSTGRSRAFINDSPVSAALLKELGARLIDIHSQHQNLLLGNKDFQLGVLDVLAADAHLLDAYRQKYVAYSAAQKELAALKEALASSSRDEEWLRFQVDEIERAALREGEQEELEQEQQELSHAEDIQAALYGAYNAIDGNEQGLLRSLRDAANALARISAHYAAASELGERIESNYIELKDCCDELQQRASRVQFAPDRLEFVDRRLALIYDLQKKHRATSLGELIEIGKGYRERLDKIDNSDWELSQARKRCTALRSELAAAATVLSEARRAAADKLKSNITDILVNLGMPMIRFEVEIKEAADFAPMGGDVVTFLFSANSISAPQPLSDVASGGEMARVMLALKSLIATNLNQPTLIFDEIDTGISGVLAERMGRLMQQMGSAQRQVLSITHLPQVAALGASHYKVYKEETAKGTLTHIVKLGKEERVREIAQMMSGEVLTEAALENAALLLSKS